MINVFLLIIGMFMDDACDVISSACFSKTPDPQIKDALVRPGQLLIMNGGHFMFEDATFKRAANWPNPPGYAGEDDQSRPAGLGSPPRVLIPHHFMLLF